MDGPPIDRTPMEEGEVRRLAREVFVPLAEAGTPGRVNRPLVRALGETGLLGRLFPSALGGTGGAGVSATELCRLREGLARECTAAETALALQGLGTYPLVQAGSDAAALELAAEADGDGWRLTGEKTWISNAPEADVYTVFARTSPASGARGV